MSEYDNKFRERLVLLKEESGLTFKSFAKKYGIPYQSLMAWINTRYDPRAYSITMVAKKCNVSADWLLGLTDKRR